MRAKAQRAVKEYETFQVETGGQDMLATDTLDRGGVGFKHVT